MWHAGMFYRKATELRETRFVFGLRGGELTTRRTFRKILREILLNQGSVVIPQSSVGLGSSLRQEASVSPCSSHWLLRWDR
jgi:hypothetical protein